MDDESESWWNRPQGKFLCIAALILCGLGSWTATDHPGEINVDMGELSWEAADCEVLVAGVQYQGASKCAPEGKYDIADGNYSECSPSLWCAVEGAECPCYGTASFGVSGDESVLGSRTTTKEVQGSINCSIEAFGKDPAPYVRKECTCHPTSLGNISYDDLVPNQCKNVDGMGMGSFTYTPKLGEFMEDQDASANCSEQDYLPWALVKVKKGADTFTRCAYAYGLSHVSSMKAESARATWQKYAKSTGKAIDCRVPNRNQNSSQASGSTGLGSEKACVVALEEVKTNSSAWASWEGAWKEQVKSRYSRCWFVTGLGFFIVAVGYFAKHVREQNASGRELNRDSRSRPLLA